MNYWAVGTNEKIDTNFYSKKRWWTDYPEDNEEGMKHRKYIKEKMKIGDVIALKRFDTHKNNLTIYAIGKVSKKTIDGFEVMEWRELHPHHITQSTYGQNSTIRKVNDKNAIDDIFQGIYQNIEGQIMLNTEEQPLNKILYGPPGTGKTYHTINKALDIIDGTVPKSRKEAKARFELLKEAGQIVFVTFHQSYGYEEFVEGIKAKTTDRGIEYKIEAGIFKRLSNKAIKHDSAFSIKLDKYITELDKNQITLKTITGVEFNIYESERGIVTSTQHSFSKDKLTDINNGIKTSNPDSTYGQFIVEDINKRFEDNTEKNYILIIDEINRGNISKIFGELITLIEESKRLGNDEAMEVTLPYSGEKFGVPKNLYIIGTMNTADRSIALMDTALRRRFEFEEMMPDYGVIRKEVGDNGIVDEINIALMLVKINQRIEYLYDRDHTIGHAYFMGVADKSSLDSAMKNKVIPLLQEYFYDDWEKIQLVLNDGFIEKHTQDVSTLFDSMADEYMEEDKYTYSIAQGFSVDSYRKIYGKIEEIE